MKQILASICLVFFIATVIAVISLIERNGVAVKVLYPLPIKTNNYAQQSGSGHCRNVRTSHSRLKRHDDVSHLNPPWLGKENRSEFFIQVEGCTSRRLGNQIFNYASLFGVAWRNGRTPLWPDGHSLVRDFFNIRIPIDVHNEIQRNRNSKFIKIIEKAPIIYNTATEHLPERNVTLAYYLVSWKYFFDFEHQLRRDLTFKDTVHLRQAQSFINASTPANWTHLTFVRVIIHVRRTDFISQAKLKNGWLQAGPDYFKRAIRYFEDCIERVQFIVISDDIRWCKRSIVGPNVVYSTGHSQITDMAIASLCDHAIITAGTFGWWVAWFAGGVTVTQAGIPPPGSPLSRLMRKADFYKPEFVRL